MSSAAAFFLCTLWKIEYILSNWNNFSILKDTKKICIWKFMCRKEYDIEEIGLGNFAPLITGKIQAIGKKKRHIV